MVSELSAIRALQWCPDGDPWSGIPGEVQLFLADGADLIEGYAPGDGWAMDFYSRQGTISLTPGKWLVQLSNGVFVVEDERPEGAELFDVHSHFQRA